MVAQPTIRPTPIDDAWAAKWREDLAFAKAQMPETHLEIDHTTPLAEIEAAIDELAKRIPALAQHEAVVELARIVARIGDGHTRLSLPIDPAAASVPPAEAELDKPIQPRLTEPLSFSWATTLLTVAAGIENAMPTLPPDGE